MSQHKRNDELTDTTLQPCPPKEPNAESLEAIREGDAFFASGELGRFDNSADLINAALNAPEMWEKLFTEEAVDSEVPEGLATWVSRSCSKASVRLRIIDLLDLSARR